MRREIWPVRGNERLSLEDKEKLFTSAKAEIAELKRTQWMLLNYCILVFGALIAVNELKVVNDLTKGSPWSLVGIVLAVLNGVVGVCALIDVQQRLKDQRLIFNSLGTFYFAQLSHMGEGYEKTAREANEKLLSNVPISIAIFCPVFIGMLITAIYFELNWLKFKCI